MTLIALLIALSIERLYPLPAVWSIDFYMQRWMNWSQTKVRYFQGQSAWALLLQILLPAALAWLLFHWLDSGLVNFIGGIIVLLLVMNAGPERVAYKQLLKTAMRADSAGYQEAAEQLRHYAHLPEGTPVERAVVWLNFVHFLAPIFFFVTFGIAGVLAYGCLRSVYRGTVQQDFDETARAQVERALWALNFIPARFAALGAALVGHFSHALPAVMAMATNTQDDNPELLHQVVEKAEGRSHHPDDRSDAVTHQLNLMKRQHLFWFVVIAVLTLTGTIV